MICHAVLVQQTAALGPRLSRRLDWRLAEQHGPHVLEHAPAAVPFQLRLHQPVPQVHVEVPAQARHATGDWVTCCGDRQYALSAAAIFLKAQQPVLTL